MKVTADRLLGAVRMASEEQRGEHYPLAASSFSKGEYCTLPQSPADSRHGIDQTPQSHSD